jgi:gliding motility-associated-like protein
MLMRLFLCFLMEIPLFLMAQSSTFDNNNEGWTSTPDAVSNTTYWINMGGNPDGYAAMTDASTGGTWYFVAPQKFHGNKCGAYGCYLRYDQFTSNNIAANDRPHIELKGGGLTLVYSSPYLPGLNWTHFDILMREDAGWYVNNLLGDPPTKAEFFTVLGNVTSLSIRGEFYSSADDNGGLDNVILEGSIEFDLDANNSSGANSGNFNADSTCYPNSNICDIDPTLVFMKPFSGIEITVLNASESEHLILDIAIPTISVQYINDHQLVLSDAGGATGADFLALIQAMSYEDESLKPKSGIRIVRFRIFNECGDLVTRSAYLPIFPPAISGNDGDTTLCTYDPPIYLFDVLTGLPDLGGYWEPALNNSGGFFDPKQDSARTYAYIIPSVGECVGGTAFVRVSIIQPFQLPPDTTLCYDESLKIKIPRPFDDWIWSTGSKQQNLTILESGTYSLTGTNEGCTYQDSIEIKYYSCQECPVYAPNAFSPNDDGQNEQWQIFLDCNWLKFHLEIYDRWGSLVFMADDPNVAWDGQVRGRYADPGVFVWQASLEFEYFGQPKPYFLKGDVSIVR